VKKFSIKVINKPEIDEDNRLFCDGRITIGTFRETFRMDLDDWTIKDYKKQWREAIKKLETNDVSCLITSLTSVDTSPTGWVWPLYKVKKTVFIRNRLISNPKPRDPNSSLLYTDFNAQNCYEFMQERDPKQKYKIFEKSVPLTDVVNFKVV